MCSLAPNAAAGRTAASPVRRQQRPRRSLILGAGTIAAMALCAGQREAFLVWNASASAPVGLYRVASPGGAERGDLVLTRPPLWAAQLAADRGYLPLGVPLVKRIAARSGDSVCALGEDVRINGRIAARSLLRDSAGRKMPAWNGCRLLGPADIFLLMEDVPDSFDGRYFGPVERARVLGRLVPLWTR